MQSPESETCEWFWSWRLDTFYAYVFISESTRLSCVWSFLFFPCQENNVQLLWMYMQISIVHTRFNSYIYSDHSCTIMNRHSRNTSQTQPSHNTPRTQTEMYTLIQQTLNSMPRIIYHHLHCHYWYSHRIICFSNISLFSKSIKIQMDFSLGWNGWFIHPLAYIGSGSFHW